MKRIDSIQVLRGIGALLILLFHLKFIGHGEYAVDIFFCISGFILMYTTQNNTKYLLTKRIIRIIPLYYLATIIMFFIVKIVPSLSLMSSANIPYLIKSLLFIPYISIGSNLNKYVVPLVSIGWTLNLEIYFYLIFTIANRINKEKRGIITITVLTIVSLLGIIFNSNNLIFNYLTNSVILEFVLGIIAFYIYKKMGNIKINRYIRVLLFIISILSFCILWYINGTSYFKNLRILRYGILSYICFLGFLFSLKEIKLPNCSMILGKISYSFYYIEFFVSAVVNKLLPIAKNSILLKSIYTLVAIVVTFIISYISWYLIENKLGAFLNDKIIKHHSKK